MGATRGWCIGGYGVGCGTSAASYRNLPSRSVSRAVDTRQGLETRHLRVRGNLAAANGSQRPETGVKNSLQVVLHTPRRTGPRRRRARPPRPSPPVDDARVSPRLQSHRGRGRRPPRRDVVVRRRGPREPGAARGGTEPADLPTRRRRHRRRHLRAHGRRRRRHRISRDTRAGHRAGYQLGARHRPLRVALRRGHLLRGRLRPSH